MYIVPSLWPHILWQYLGHNDFPLVLRPLEWRLISGWAFAQFLRLIRVLAVRIEKPKVLTYPSQNFAGCLREISRSFCVNFRRVSPRNFAEKTLREINDFYFSPRKQIFAQGAFRVRKRKKSFFLG